MFESAKALHFFVGTWPLEQFERVGSLSSDPTLLDYSCSTLVEVNPRLREKAPKSL